MEDQIKPVDWANQQGIGVDFVMKHLRAAGVVVRTHFSKVDRSNYDKIADVVAKEKQRIASARTLQNETVVNRIQEGVVRGVATSNSDVVLHNWLKKNNKSLDAAVACLKWFTDCSHYSEWNRMCPEYVAALEEHIDEFGTVYGWAIEHHCDPQIIVKCLRQFAWFRGEAGSNTLVHIPTLDKLEGDLDSYYTITPNEWAKLHGIRSGLIEMMVLIPLRKAQVQDANGKYVITGTSEIIAREFRKIEGTENVIKPCQSNDSLIRTTQVKPVQVVVPPPRPAPARPVQVKPVQVVVPPPRPAPAKPVQVKSVLDGDRKIYVENGAQIFLERFGQGDSAREKLAAFLQTNFVVRNVERQSWILCEQRTRIQKSEKYDTETQHARVQVADVPFDGPVCEIPSAYYRVGWFQELLVQKNPSNIQYFVKLGASADLIKLALSKNGHVFQYVDESKWPRGLVEEFQKIAEKQSLRSVKYFHYLSESHAKELLAKENLSIGRDVSGWRLCLDGELGKPPEYLCNIDIDSFDDKDFFYKKVVSRNGLFLKFIKNASDDVQFLAVTQNVESLEFADLTKRNVCQALTVPDVSLAHYSDPDDWKVVVRKNDLIGLDKVIGVFSKQVHEENFIEKEWFQRCAVQRRAANVCFLKNVVEDVAIRAIKGSVDYLPFCPITPKTLRKAIECGGRIDYYPEGSCWRVVNVAGIGIVNLDAVQNEEWFASFYTDIVRYKATNIKWIKNPSLEVQRLALHCDIAVLSLVEKSEENVLLAFSGAERRAAKCEDNSSLDDVRDRVNALVTLVKAGECDEWIDGCEESFEKLVEQRKSINNASYNIKYINLLHHQLAWYLYTQKRDYCLDNEGDSWYIVHTNYDPYKIAIDLTSEYNKYFFFLWVVRHNREYIEKIDDEEMKRKVARACGIELSGSETIVAVEATETTEDVVESVEVEEIVEDIVEEIDDEGAEVVDEESVDEETIDEELVDEDTFVDSRDNQTYRVAKIGGQLWMVDNLRYVCKDSYSYQNVALNDAEYGRLYTWNAAVNAVPAGWRLPNNEDYEKLCKELSLSDSDELLSFNNIFPGKRWPDGSYHNIDASADYWCTEELVSGFAICYHVDTMSPSLSSRICETTEAFSVRLIKE